MSRLFWFPHAQDPSATHKFDSDRYLLQGNGSLTTYISFERTNFLSRLYGVRDRISAMRVHVRSLASTTWTKNREPSDIHGEGIVITHRRQKCSNFGQGNRVLEEINQVVLINENYESDDDRPHKVRAWCDIECGAFEDWFREEEVDSRMTTLLGSDVAPELKPLIIQYTYTTRHLHVGIVTITRTRASYCHAVYFNARLSRELLNCVGSASIRVTRACR